MPAEREAESETMSTESDLRVEVVDDEIIVSLPEWFYSVTYYKPERAPSCSQRTSRTEMIRALR